MSDPKRDIKLTHQSAYYKIMNIMEKLPDEDSRQLVLTALLSNRCRKCLEYDPNGQFWCCYDSRGG